MRVGVILYGPPASGKDTITRALHDQDPRFRLFARLKAGPGKTAGYRMTTAEHLDQLRAAGLIVWENHRYGATYAVDVPELAAQLVQGIPVLHLGQVPAVDAVQGAAPAAWLTVALTTDRDDAERRLQLRNPDDVTERLAAWDATEPYPAADLSIDTSTTMPADAAALIRDRVSHLSQLSHPQGATHS